MNSDSTLHKPLPLAAIANLADAVNKANEEMHIYFLAYGVPKEMAPFAHDFFRLEKLALPSPMPEQDRELFQNGLKAMLAGCPEA